MKKTLFILQLCLALNFSTFSTALAQCAMCAKTAEQMGEKPAEGMNSGILYLMITPFVVVGIIGFRWWKNNGKKSIN